MCYGLSKKIIDLYEWYFLYVKHFTADQAALLAQCRKEDSPGKGA